MAADTIRINGFVHSWGSITCKIDGQKFFGFTSVGYSDKITRALQWGMGKHGAPRARTRGKYEPGECKLGGPKDTVHALRQALAAKSPSGNSYGVTEFQVILQYIDVGVTPLIVNLDKCLWFSNDSSEEEGGDPLKEEFGFQPMKIKRNGLVLFDDSGGSP